MSTTADSRSLILASGSPRRRELLAGLGWSPLVRPSEVDETPRPDEPADVYVLRLAKAKAQATGTPGELILAADTVVAVDGKLLGKPVDAADAARMLLSLSGRAHQVYTGVAVWDPANGRLEATVTATDVVFAELSDDDIEWYVASQEPMDKAGAYAIQGLAALFVESLDGNYSNVVGLPLPAARKLLARHGFDLLHRSVADIRR